VKVFAFVYASFRKKRQKSYHISAVFLPSPACLGGFRERQREAMQSDAKQCKAMQSNAKHRKATQSKAKQSKDKRSEAN
jgi:hypothetical protein